MQERIDATPATLYALVSSDRQDVDLSVAAYLRALRDYAERNGLRMGWSRIPLPSDAYGSPRAPSDADFGRLIDTDSSVDGLLDPSIVVPTRTDATQLQSADCSITIGWDHLGANQTVMSDQDRVQRRGDVLDV